MANEDVIAAVIENVAGHDVLPLIDVLKGKKNVSEFTIAEELKEEINTIRNKLYRLYDSNLVEFTRKKDKKKGWYIYYWTFVPARIPHIMREIKRKKLEKLKERITTEQKSDFFECSNKCMRLTFDKAVDFEFKCPECGNLMNQEDNKKKIETIQGEIEDLQREIANEPVFVVEENIEMIEDDKDMEAEVVKHDFKVTHKYSGTKSSPKNKIASKVPSKSSKSNKKK